jgi:hypothetical protein
VTITVLAPDHHAFSLVQNVMVTKRTSSHWFVEKIRQVLPDILFSFGMYKNI